MYIVAGIAAISFFVDLMAFDIRRLAQFSSTDMNKYVSDRDRDPYKESLLGPDSNTKRYKNQNLNRIDETQEDDDTTAAAYDADADADVDTVEMSSQLSEIDKTNTTGTGTGTGYTKLDGIEENADQMYHTLGTRVTHLTFQTYDSNRLLYDKLRLKIETFAFDALWELPWKLIPFVFGLFIIVGFMEAIGFVDWLAMQLLNIVTNTWSAMFIVGFTATILCQVVNNQPMTVLLSFVLDRVKEKYNEDHPTEDGPEWITAAFFALAIGANLGGNGTPIASLAVLMWQGILAKWKIYLTYIGFSKRGVGVTPLLVACCVAIVVFEVSFLIIYEHQW